MKKLLGTLVLCISGLSLVGQPVRLLTWNALNFAASSEARVGYFRTARPGGLPKLQAG